MEDQQYIGPYRINNEIGWGMQTVYDGVDTERNRRIVAKVVDPENKGDTIAFQREVTALRHMPKHPHIVKYIDAVASPLAVILEHIPGMNLMRHIERRGALPVAQSKQYTERILSALSNVHDNTIIHRDIKPENIMITRAGPVLVDFGLAYHPDVEHLENPDDVLGTPYYMSPEMVVGSEYIDHRQDIYSLGITLFEMLTAMKPYEGRVVSDIVRQHVESKVPAPTDWDPRIPTEISDIVLRATHRDPRERYFSAPDMAADLAFAPTERVTRVSSVHRRAA